MCSALESVLVRYVYGDGPSFILGNGNLCFLYYSVCLDASQFY